MSKKFTAHFRDGKLIRFKGNLSQLNELLHDLRNHDALQSLKNEGEPKQPDPSMDIKTPHPSFSENGVANPQPAPGVYEHIKYGSGLNPNRFFITTPINWNPFHISKEMEIAKVEGVSIDNDGTMKTEFSFSDDHIENCRRMGFEIPYEVLVGKINEQISGILPDKIGELMAENLDEKFIRKHPMPNSFHQAVAYSFNWGQTPQGFNFWRNVAAQQFEAALYELSLMEG